MIDWQPFENELIRYAYRKIWKQEWKGHDIPRHVFRSFLSNVSFISDRFTQDRRQLKSNYLDQKEGLYGYLLYFHLANVQRNLAVIDEMIIRGLWSKPPKRVLDFGAGLGASMWAMGLALSSNGWSEGIEFVAVDRSKKALIEVKELFDHFKKMTGRSKDVLTTHVMDVFDSRTAAQIEKMGSFDLIICSNVMNELNQVSSAKAYGLLKILYRAVSSNGYLAVIEPALHESSRTLTSLRDHLLKDEPCHFPLPCGHEGFCPLNREPRDWCHFEKPWSPPSLRYRFEKALGHHSGMLKYSYLVFAKSGSKKNQAVYRVISDKLKEKDGSSAWLLCSPDQKLKLVAGREERMLPILKGLKRGDLITGTFESISRRQDLKTYAQDVKMTKAISKL